LHSTFAVIKPSKEVVYTCAEIRLNFYGFIDVPDLGWTPIYIIEFVCSFGWFQIWEKNTVL